MFTIISQFISSKLLTVTHYQTHLQTVWGQICKQYFSISVTSVGGIPLCTMTFFSYIKIVISLLFVVRAQNFLVFFE